MGRSTKRDAPDIFPSWNRFLKKFCQGCPQASLPSGVRYAPFQGCTACDMLRAMTRGTWTSTALSLLISSSCTLGCDEEAPSPPPEEKAEAPAEEPEPEIESPPHLVIGEDGPTVRGTSVEGGKKSGTIPTVELDKLKNYLAEEKKFIEGKELKVVIARKAKRGWVSAYLTELGALGASKLTIVTETRKEFSGTLDFLPPGKLSELDGCVMIGQVTKHNGSALWQLKGGTAAERGPGLGGPDLSMAKEVFQKNYTKCESDVFVTDGANEKDWGFIFDMAAAAVSTPEVTIKQALLPSEPQTAGRKVK
jgi:hypothetical protein